MTMSRRKIIYPFGCAIVAASFLVILLIVQRISIEETIIFKDEYTYRNNGKTIKIEYGIKKDKNNEKSGYIKRKSLFSIKTLKLEGFEDSIEPCADINFKINDQIGQGICFTGDVGAHSQNIVLLKFEGQKFKPMYFYNEDYSYNISSDVPKFELLDENEDGLTDIEIKFRDYNSDPLTKEVTEIYLGNGNGFVFDREI